MLLRTGMKCLLDCNTMLLLSLAAVAVARSLHNIAAWKIEENYTPKPPAIGVKVMSVSHKNIPPNGFVYKIKTQEEGLISLNGQYVLQ